MAVDNVDMRVCATDARYSKSLEQRYQRTVYFLAADRILSICPTVFSLTVVLWMPNVGMWVGMQWALGTVEVRNSVVEEQRVSRLLNIGCF